METKKPVSFLRLKEKGNTSNPKIKLENITVRKKKKKAKREKGEII